MKTDDLEFIKRLDNKLRHVNDIMQFRMNKKTTEYIRMTKKEYQKLCKIISTNDFIINPVSLGFIGGFSIYSYPENNFIRDKNVCDLVLLFRKDQLPEGINWDDLKPIFNSEKNNKLLKFYGFNKIESENYYDY